MTHLDKSIEYMKNFGTYTHFFAYPTCTDISGATLIVINTASDTSLSFNDVIDSVPAENNFAQNKSDMFSIVGIDPMDTSCAVALRSASKPIVKIFDAQYGMTSHIKSEPRSYHQNEIRTDSSFKTPVSKTNG